ncbi:MAG: caspase family protein [Neomegalonema sp.]|nr:caspase family protein [Neomegalonema sp.]
MQWRIVFCLTVYLAGALALAEAAQARSVALVIGNSKYKVAGLRNPVNDATEMTARFKALKFDEVIKRIDLDKAGLDEAVARFARKARGADTAVIFFSGHGIEIGGRNYLVPVRHGITHPSDARFRTKRLEDLIHAVSGARRLAVVIVDACRDNPWSGTKGAKGLARVETSAPGMVIAFSTAPGKVALDGRGRLSPYTRALSEKLAARPTLDVRKLFTSLTARTRKLAGVDQQPWAEFGEFPEADVAFVASAPPPPPPPPGPMGGASIVVGATIDAPITVRVGTVLLSPDRRKRAEVRAVRTLEVEFLIAGKATKCAIWDVCSFGWRGSPTFRVSRKDEKPGVAYLINK